MVERPVRPRDAAGLVLLRPGPGGPAVLMGRRHRKARFLPGILVFPGGCLESADLEPSGFEERLQPPPSGIDSASRRKLAGLLRCAFRETWEETGVLVGSGTEAPAHAGLATHWRAYAERGLAPALHRPRLLARAITPAGSPIRFHTRFFLAVTDEVVEAKPGDGELEGVGWIPAEEALGEDLIDVTRFMLERALGPGATDPAPLYRYRGERRLVELGGQRLPWQEAR